MTEELKEALGAEALHALAIAKEAEHKAIQEMVRTEAETQTKQISDRMDVFELYAKGRFESGERRMNELATKTDLEQLRALFIDPKTGENYVTQLIIVMQNFTIAAKLLTSGGRWIYRTLVALAILVGAVSLLTGGFKMAGAALVHWLLPSPQ